MITNLRTMNTKLGVLKNLNSLHNSTTKMPESTNSIRKRIIRREILRNLKVGKKDIAAQIHLVRKHPIVEILDTQMLKSQPKICTTEYSKHINSEEKKITSNNIPKQLRFLDRKQLDIYPYTKGIGTHFHSFLNLPETEYDNKSLHILLSDINRTLHIITQQQEQSLNPQTILQEGINDRKQLITSSVKCLVSNIITKRQLRHEPLNWEIPSNSSHIYQILTNDINDPSTLKKFNKDDIIPNNYIDLYAIQWIITKITVSQDLYNIVIYWTVPFSWPTSIIKDKSYQIDDTTYNRNTNEFYVPAKECYYSTIRSTFQKSTSFETIIPNNIPQKNDPLPLSHVRCTNFLLKHTQKYLDTFVQTIRWDLTQRIHVRSNNTQKKKY